MSASREQSREETGVATIETMLVAIPIVLFTMLAVYSAKTLLLEQGARNEAHSDVMDKAYAFSTSMADGLAAQEALIFGELTAEGRRHSLKPAAAEIPEGVTADFGPPDALTTTFGGSEFTMIDGLPNSVIEGWGLTRYEDQFGSGSEQAFARYAILLRSPWTRLGYPYLVTQDFMLEPRQMQAWGQSLIEDQDGVDSDLIDQLLLTP